MTRGSSDAKTGEKGRGIKFRVWFTESGRSLLGKGGADVLESIAETHSISKAAEQLGRSYRQVWGQVNEIEESLGEPLVTRFKGGVKKGGAELTQAGFTLLKEYRRVNEYVKCLLEDKFFWEACGLKLSARNKLRGEITSVEKDGVVAKINLTINVPAKITAVITTEAADDLNLKEGDKVGAIIKATEVLISKEE